MHGLLAPHLHPKCAEAIEALHRCHAENPKGKLAGACNDANQVLENCLREEREESRAENSRRAKARKDAMRKRLSEQ